MLLTSSVAAAAAAWASAACSRRRTPAVVTAVPVGKGLMGEVRADRQSRLGWGPEGWRMQEGQF
jgi:hypothetical protein